MSYIFFKPARGGWVGKSIAKKGVGWHLDLEFIQIIIRFT